MRLNLSSGKPLFLQISEEIEEGVLTGAYPEETQIPSTTEISTAFQINPATVLKGMNVLVDDEILYKKRGLGMFVKAGARQVVIEKRTAAFFEDYVRVMIAEAQRLGFSKEYLLTLVQGGYIDESN